MHTIYLYVERLEDSQHVFVKLLVYNLCSLLRIFFMWKLYFLFNEDSKNFFSILFQETYVPTAVTPVY